MEKKTIIFVRHGESEYNKAMRDTGEDPFIRDAPLTAHGRAQAQEAQAKLQELQKELGGEGWLLLSSPLQRALDTAAGLWPECFFGAAASLEVWPELREVVTGCDDLGSTPSVLLKKYPHLQQLHDLPEIWWTIPKAYQDLPADGHALRDAYRYDPDAFEEADAALFESRVELLIKKLAAVPESKIVLVAHCDLMGELTEKMGLKEKKSDGSFRNGWWLRNCECRMLRDFHF